MKCGTYRTAKGSIVRISGKYCLASEIAFDWIEEDGACCDCRPSVDFDSQLLTWDCECHESGSTPLIADPEAEV